MAVTPINSEDRLVQATFADHLEQVLGWDSIYAWNEETFGPDGTLGRADTKQAVLTRDLRAALERLNPDLPASADRRRNAGADRVRRQPIDGAAQPRFLSAAPRWRARGIPGPPGAPEIRPRPSDRLR